MRHRLVPICVLLITCVLADSACGWGSEGHVIVAHIAKMHLNKDTRSKVDALLAIDTDSRHHNLAYASTWPDLIKSPKLYEPDDYPYS